MVVIVEVRRRVTEGSRHNCFEERFKDHGGRHGVVMHTSMVPVIYTPGNRGTQLAANHCGCVWLRVAASCGCVWLGQVGIVLF